MACAGLSITVGASLGALRATAGPAEVMVDIGAPAQVHAGVPQAGLAEPVRYEGTFDVRGVYIVEAGRLTVDAPHRVDPAHAEMWRRVRTVVPPRWQDRIGQFAVVGQGQAGTVAIVHRSQRIEGTWILSVDEADAEPRGLLERTLVHELAHMVSLGVADFRFTDDPAGCEGVAMALGCARADSLVHRFAARFWPDAGETAEFDPDVFVSHYATTSVHEDLAETFMAWVLGEEVPAGSVLAEKFAFMDRQGTLDDLRDALEAHGGLPAP